MINLMFAIYFAPMLGNALAEREYLPASFYGFGFVINLAAFVCFCLFG